MTHTLERRKEILALANEHNFLILEGLRDLPSEMSLYDADLLVDDPYFYLYFSDQPRPSSYFKLDGQGPYPRGRVLRFDSLSKVLSAGLRFGFATGPARLIERINVHVGYCLIAEPEIVLTLGKRPPLPICKDLRLSKPLSKHYLMPGVTAPSWSIRVESPASTGRSEIYLRGPCSDISLD
jgi:hypothetical protein